MPRHCQNCNKPGLTNLSARFCSPRCRVAHARWQEEEERKENREAWAKDPAAFLRKLGLAGVACPTCESTLTRRSKRRAA